MSFFLTFHRSCNLVIVCVLRRDSFFYIETAMNKEFWGPASMVRMEVYKRKEKLTLSKKKIHVFFTQAFCVQQIKAVIIWVFLSVLSLLGGMVIPVLCCPRDPNELR